MEGLIRLTLSIYCETVYNRNKDETFSAEPSAFILFVNPMVYE
jgi:hypothetical protein